LADSQPIGRTAAKYSSSPPTLSEVGA
jgi:hypothetical protein